MQDLNPCWWRAGAGRSDFYSKAQEAYAASSAAAQVGGDSGELFDTADNSNGGAAVTLEQQLAAHPDDELVRDKLLK
jgi:hypothetical protein